MKFHTDQIIIYLQSTSYLPERAFLGSKLCGYYLGMINQIKKNFFFLAQCVDYDGAVLNLTQKRHGCSISRTSRPWTLYLNILWFSISFSNLEHSRTPLRV